MIIQNISFLDIINTKSDNLNKTIKSRLRINKKEKEIQNIPMKD